MTTPVWKKAGLQAAAGVSGKLTATERKALAEHYDTTEDSIRIKQAITRERARRGSFCTERDIRY